jgi:hypothetical protein
MFNIIIFRTKLLLSKALVTIADLLERRSLVLKIIILNIILYHTKLPTSSWKPKSVWNKSAMVINALERRSLVLKIIILNSRFVSHTRGFQEEVGNFAWYKIMFNIIIFKTKLLLSKALVTIRLWSPMP